MCLGVCIVNKLNFVGHVSRIFKEDVRMSVSAIYTDFVYCSCMVPPLASQR